MSIESISFESDEKVLKEVRKHWFIVFTQYFGMLVVALFPLVAYISLSLIPPFVPLLTLVNTPLLIAGYSGWLILVWMGLFSIWTNYYLDIWTLTNKRLITVDQRGLFSRNTGSFRLERLQDINVSVRGILATFLKFGDLEAETASSDKNFVAKGIPDPQGFKALILQASDSTTFVQKPMGGGATATAPQQVNDGL